KRGQHAGVSAFGVQKTGYGGNGQDIDLFKPIVIPENKDDTVQNTLYALGFVPTARRVQSLPDSVKDDNWARVAMLLGMAAINFPRDVEELRRGLGEGVSIYKNGLKKTEFVNAQRPFHMLSGTFVEKLTKKYPKFRKTYDKLDKFDKVLYDTKFGKLVKKIFGLKPPETVSVNASGFGTVAENGYKFRQGYFRNVIGKSLFRISRLGLLTTTLFELPALIKSVTQGDTIKERVESFGKQLLKSAGYITFVNVGTAIGGAMVGPSVIAQLLGMGAGAGLGLMTSKALNNKIDKCG
ncbi:MAG: hypothetical protein GX568_10385, partial [Candidatus Gastranaerophilales bacterium]|nr:hypothetical protein [Candidatus Gastranaerophilales bacterium]